MENKQILLESITKAIESNPELETKVKRFFKEVEEVWDELGKTNKQAVKRILSNLITSPLLHWGATSVAEKQLLIKASELQILTAEIYTELKPYLTEGGNNNDKTIVD